MVGMVPRPLLLAVALVPLLFSPAHPTPQDPALEAQFGEIADSLMCQCGCNKMLSICDMQGCHSATPMRAEVKEKLAAGQSKEAILAGFVDRYGLVALSAPPATHRRESGAEEPGRQEGAHLRGHQGCRLRIPGR